MEQSTDPLFEITWSGPSPVASWGKWVVHAKATDANGVLKGLINGYGDDEAAALRDAMNTSLRVR